MRSILPPRGTNREHSAGRSAPEHNKNRRATEQEHQQFIARNARFIEGRLSNNDKYKAVPVSFRATILQMTSSRAQQCFKEQQSFKVTQQSFNIPRNPFRSLPKTGRFSTGNCVDAGLEGVIGSEAAPAAWGANSDYIPLAS